MTNVAMLPHGRAQGFQWRNQQRGQDAVHEYAAAERDNAVRCGLNAIAHYLSASSLNLTFKV